MKCFTYSFMIGLLALPVGMGRAEAASEEASGAIPLGAPPPNPVTLWNFLGIPQGINQMRDARVNRLGNNPQAERKLPLKRIADPENMQSKNPAIAAAAKIKADEDLAAQKIKAIKYLATIGCCCAQNKDMVKDALLAALDDCTEEVRLSAAKALLEVSGNPCNPCEGCSCCTADVMNKLNDMAYGQDERGCCREPSARVREMAAAALQSCRNVKRPTAPAPETPEAKPETPPPPPGEAPVKPSPVPPAVTPPPAAVPPPPAAPGAPVKPAPVAPATPGVNRAAATIYVPVTRGDAAGFAQASDGNLPEATTLNMSAARVLLVKHSSAGAAERKAEVAKTVPLEPATESPAVAAPTADKPPVEKPQALASIFDVDRIAAPIRGMGTQPQSAQTPTPSRLAWIESEPCPKPIVTVE